MVIKQCCGRTARACLRPGFSGRRGGRGVLTCTSRWLVWRRSVVILPQQLYLCTQVRFVPINEGRRQAGFEATISTSLHPLPGSGSGRGWVWVSPKRWCVGPNEGVVLRCYRSRGSLACFAFTDARLFRPGTPLMRRVAAHRCQGGKCGCGCHPNSGAWDQTEVLCCGVTARVAR